MRAHVMEKVLGLFGLNCDETKQEIHFFNIKDRLTMSKL